MNRIFAGDRYTNVTTGAVVEVQRVDETYGGVTIATVTTDGRKINQRRIQATSLRNSATNAKGVKYLGGYVRSDLLRDEITETAPNKETPVEPTAIDTDIDFAELSDEELATFAARSDAMAKRMADLVDDAKAEMRKRATETGTRIFGDVAVNVASNNRFNAALALANLNARQYDAICVNKPDPTLAKQILGEDSPAYRSTLKAGDWRITVRMATDEDREAARIAEQRMELATFLPGDTFDGKAPF